MAVYGMKCVDASGVMYQNSGYTRLLLAPSHTWLLMSSQSVHMRGKDGARGHAPSVKLLRGRALEWAHSHGIQTRGARGMRQSMMPASRSSSADLAGLFGCLLRLNQGRTKFVGHQP
eukprot:351352-Chlamydomonas_euryale.AAC.6